MYPKKPSIILFYLLVALYFNQLTFAGRHIRVTSLENHDDKNNQQQPLPISVKELSITTTNSNVEDSTSKTNNLTLSINNNHGSVAKQNFDDLNFSGLSKPDYCIATPSKLNFCTSRLGWGSNMGIPNLLGQKSEQELNDLAQNIRLEEILAVKCKASYHLKVLLCSIMSPTCLDVMIPPCKRMCITTRASCEPALVRAGLGWPKFLDCRRFPRPQEVCLDRQPIVLDASNLQSLDKLRHNLESSSNSSYRALMKRKRKEKKFRSRLITSTPLPSHTTTTVNNSTDFITKDLEFSSNLWKDPSITDVIPLSTTTISVQSPTTTLTTTAPPTTTITPTIPPADKTNTLSSKPESTNVNNRDNSTEGSISSSQVPTRDYSSMPVNVTDDLTQLLCSTSPTWLVKAKLSDSQLMNAVARRRMKVRSFRQIFGTLPSSSNITSKSSTNNPLARKNTSATSLYLTLTNTTIFVTAMGQHIYTQPLNDALPKPNESQANLMKSVRYYLIAGTSSPSSTNAAKSTTMFVVWPQNIKTNHFDPENQGSLNIVMTYRDLKRKGAKVCEEAHSSLYSSSSNLQPTSLSTDIVSLQNNDTFDETNVGQRPQSRGLVTPKVRNKKKRVHNIHSVEH